VWRRKAPHILGGAVFLRKYEPSLRAAARARKVPSRRPLSRRFKNCQRTLEKYRLSLSGVYSDEYREAKSAPSPLIY
jgi:hypothetical protein